MIGGLLAGWDEVVGVEGEREYADIANARLHWWTLQPSPDLALAEMAEENEQAERQLRMF